ncbi:arylsulfatase j [Plakobranchus ocellatus]|uniref:Arylsulfatase j n=1 Tax=Plakobranchus ocellatus TaxID=259542 RepID=A0AAV4A383_9GAST|nr:arylsulfatase j [Plakobranchus ocellatus]
MNSLEKAIVFLVLLTQAYGAVQRKPNIVVILSDDQGFHDIGYHGSEIATPHLDQLAAAGVKLENYYVQPVCSPTRSQLMTGRYQIHTGLQHRIIRPSQPYGLPLQYPTIADLLHDNGYSTHAIGKWHLGFYKKEYTPLFRGFDTFYGILPGASDHYTYEQCDVFRGKNNMSESLDKVTFCGNTLLDMDQPVIDANGTFSTHLYTKKAIEVVEKAAQLDKPMFMYLSYQVPHSPIQAPEHYYINITNIVNQNRTIYAGMLASMDEGVRNLTDALKQNGLWNNTILIFSSDNGGRPSFGASNWPLRGVKSTLWEGGIRTIGFVTSPLFSPEQSGKSSTELMHVSDWFPTIADMAGATVNSSLDLDGVSQWEMIKEGKPSTRKEILHNIDILSPAQGTRFYNDTFDTRIRAAIRVGNYKLITGDPGDGDWYPIPGITNYIKKAFHSKFDPNAKNLWLFDVAQDPEETTDLSASMPKVVRKLLDKLSKYNATALPPWYPDSDPNSDPPLNGNMWQPWVQS